MVDMRRLNTTIASIDKAMEQPVAIEAVPGMAAVRMKPGQLSTMYALMEAKSTLQEVREDIRQAREGVTLPDPKLGYVVDKSLEENLSNFLMTIYEHGTNPNALKEARAILKFLDGRTE